MTGIPDLNNNELCCMGDAMKLCYAFRTTIHGADFKNRLKPHSTEIPHCPDRSWSIRDTHFVAIKPLNNATATNSSIVPSNRLTQAQRNTMN
jgi:hypothetical protein